MAAAEELTPQVVGSRVVKVLFVGPLPDPVTGQSLACQVFLDELRHHHEVEVINLSKRDFAQGMDSLRRVREVLGIAWQVARRQARADVVYLTTAESMAGNLKDLVLLSLCGRRLSSVTVHLHGGAGMRELLRPGRTVLRGLNRLLLHRLGAVVVLGGRQVDIFDGLVERDHIRIVPNFAQDELFLDEDAVRAKFRAQEPLRLLFLSNLLPGKGHEELVDAVRSLTPDLQGRVHLDIAGAFDGPAARDAFEKRIAGCPNITVHGVVRGAQKRALLQGAHLFCLPTYYPYEGQPISILEAYAAGCAVLTTDHSGIFDVFTPDVSGLVVEKRSSESIRRALTVALGNPAPLEAMALANRREAQEKYRTTRYNEQLLGVLQALLH